MAWGPFSVIFLTGVGQNLQILADENRSLTVRCALDDSADRIKQYGAIRNMGVQVHKLIPRECGNKKL